MIKNKNQQYSSLGSTKKGLLDLLKFQKQILETWKIKYLSHMSSYLYIYIMLQEINLFLYLVFTSGFPMKQIIVVAYYSTLKILINLVFN